MKKSGSCKIVLLCSICKRPKDVCRNSCVIDTKPGYQEFNSESDVQRTLMLASKIVRFANELNRYG